MAHAEASARTVDAAVVAAAIQLGLRPDQVDIEVLEDPVPSTFGYIGTPARVRVTPRSGSSSDGSTSTDSSALEPSAGGSGPAVPSSAETSGAGSAASAGAVSAATDTPAQVAGDAAGPAATDAPDAAPGVGVASADAIDGPVSAGAAGSVAAQAPAGVADGAAAADPGADRQVSADPGASNASLSQATQVASSTSTPAPTSTPAAGSAAEASPDPVLSSPPRSGSDPASTSTPDPEAGPTSGRLADASVTAKNDPSDPSLTIRSDSSNHPDPTSISGADSGSVAEAGQVASAGIDESTPSISTPEAAAVPAAQPSSALASGNGDRTSDGEAGRATSALPASSAVPEPPSSESSRETRSPRRTYRDEPIEPVMVEADTERAGDFLEGLLDALDVDGDITTWVDEVGGHIDLEGSELDVLVGSNGETLDALQELTRLAVLRQSKRRARLLLDINGFRARQREQLVSIVKATAEQVIRTREDHEFQPMTPAERKIVHDAVAVIDGARTESLGEDPHRRVVIRPA